MNALKTEQADRIARAIKANAESYVDKAAGSGREAERAGVANAVTKLVAPKVAA